MKRFLILISVCLCVLFGNAQVLNSSGQKVVRKIDIYGTNDVKPYITINFNYSNLLKLEEIVFITSASGKIVWKKNGDNLTRTEYNDEGKLRKDLVYHYEFTNGLITKCVIDNIGIEGNVLRYSYFYQYDNDRIIIADKRVYTRERYSSFEELSDRYREVFEWDSDGNVFTTEEKGWRSGQMFNFPILKKQREYFYDYNNNTNIDLSLLYNSISGLERIEMVTEWFGQHSLCLIEKDSNIYLDYSFNEDGDILEMQEYTYFKKLKRLYKIYYWE